MFWGVFICPSDCLYSLLHITYLSQNFYVGGLDQGKNWLNFGKDLEHIMDNKATAAAVISRLRISNNGELKVI